MKRGRKQFDRKKPNVVARKLKMAFKLGRSDKEAYRSVGISRSAFYAYQQKHPEFSNEKKSIRLRLTEQSRRHSYRLFSEQILLGAST